MSRIGKQPVPVPSGASVKIVGREVTASGPKGSLSWAHPFTVEVTYDAASSAVKVIRKEETKHGRATHGLTRALIANMVKGVTEGFEKRLLIYGTGYNCKLAGGKLHLNVGFTGRRRGLGSQFELTVPKGVEIVIEREAARGDTDPAALLVRGIDRQQVGQFAAEIRALRKTEPYKAKGIRYEGEHIRRKQGKALTGSG